MKKHADQLTFRTWLIRQLELTRWSSPSGVSLPTLAEELGITLPVLEEAIRRRELGLQGAGKPRRVRGKRLMERSDYALLRVTMPDPVYRDWQEYVRVLRTTPATLFRSLVHGFLLDPHRPTTTTRSWHYRGKLHQLESSGLRRKRQSAVTRITRGAQIALDHHALTWNVPPTYVARGLITDLLEGRSLKRLKIVSYPELWGAIPIATCTQRNFHEPSQFVSARRPERYRKWCRAHVQQAYLGEQTALCRVLGKFLMYVDTTDLSLTPHLLMNGFWEMWVTQAIARYVKPGMRCVDVGANCGYYTLLLADLVGENGYVAAYEPQVRLADLLVRSTAVNGFSKNAWVIECALGSQNDELVELYGTDKFLGSASLLHSSYSNQRHKTRVRTLDDESDGFDFVKIDVQGYELQVLAGMQGVIARSPKIAIAMEFTPSDHDEPLGALETIQGYGLKIESIGTDGIVRPIGLAEAVLPSTGDHRMLWLTRQSPKGPEACP